VICNDPYSSLEKIARERVAKLREELAPYLPANSTQIVKFKSEQGHDVTATFMDKDGSGIDTLFNIEIESKSGILKLFHQKTK
jgi:hypothetical protein